MRYVGKDDTHVYLKCGYCKKVHAYAAWSDAEEQPEKVCVGCGKPFRTIFFAQLRSVSRRCSHGYLLWLWLCFHLYSWRRWTPGSCSTSISSIWLSQRPTPCCHPLWLPWSAQLYLKACPGCPQTRPSQGLVKRCHLCFWLRKRHCWCSWSMWYLPWITARCQSTPQTRMSLSSILAQP